MRSFYKILFTLFVVGFLFVLIPAKQAFAGQCKAQINFQAQPNPVPENKTLTFSGYVKLEGSVWEPPGTPNAGYCLVGTYPLKEVLVSIQSSKFPGALVTNLVSLKPSDVGPHSYSFSWAPSSVNLKSGSSFDAYAVASGYNRQTYQQLAKSSAINVNVIAAAFGTYACVAGNGKYACSPGVRPDCSDVPASSNCQPNSCVQISDTKQCDQPATAGMHKACINNACVNVQGTGSDSCSTNSDCTGGAGGSQNFDIPNPIGINTFEELVNVIGTWIFNLAIPIAVIIIIYAGVIMLTSGGNPGRFKKGMDALRWAVIGLAVVLIGKGFVSLIKSILSLKNP